MRPEGCLRGGPIGTSGGEGSYRDKLKFPAQPLEPPDLSNPGSSLEVDTSNCFGNLF